MFLWCVLRSYMIWTKFNDLTLVKFILVKMTWYNVARVVSCLELRFQKSRKVLNHSKITGLLRGRKHTRVGTTIVKKTNAFTLYIWCFSSCNQAQIPEVYHDTINYLFTVLCFVVCLFFFQMRTRCLSSPLSHQQFQLSTLSPSPWWRAQPRESLCACREPP